MYPESSPFENLNTKDSHDFNDPFTFNFDSFVEPSMLLSDSMGGYEGLSASDLALLDVIPSVPSEIPSLTNSSSNNNNNNLTNHTNRPSSSNLYDKLTSPSLTANSPALYPYPSPYFSTGSPSSVTMSNDPSWMHSSKPRRRRSNYVSPVMPSSQFMMPSPGQMAMGLNAMNMAQAGIYTNSPPMHMMPMGLHNHPSMMYTPMGPMMMPMSPMNVTVKLPMAPLTPTSTIQNIAVQGIKIPLVLPSRLQNSSVPVKNTVAPNIAPSLPSSLAPSIVPSGIASRCSIAPSSSVSNTSSTRWFTEMSATKDSFLKEIESIDFTNVTVIELKQVLRKFGLNSTGKKVQLAERILDIATYLQKEGKKRSKTETVCDLESAESTAVSAVPSLAVN